MRSQNCRLKLDRMLRTPRHFKPGVKALFDECYSRGNVNRMIEDFIELVWTSSSAPATVSVSVETWA